MSGRGGADDATDYRAHPEAYVVGRGERGVWTTEPYTSELKPLWRFRTPVEAEASADALVERFEAYRREGDFVGMDMARKFIQMGYTRSRRYARHASGRKYDADGNELPEDPDEEKARSAAIFEARWRRVREDPAYLRAKQEHRARRAEGDAAAP